MFSEGRRATRLKFRSPIRQAIRILAWPVRPSLSVNINAVKIKTLPELDDEFAKDCGAYTSLAELQERLRTQMEKALKREIEDTYKTRS